MNNEWAQVVRLLGGPPPTAQPEFGQWLAMRRSMTKGRTQGHVAAAVGIDRSTLCKIEHGQRGVSWERGWALVEATNWIPRVHRAPCATLAAPTRD